MLLSVIFICYLFSVIFQSYLIDLIQSWTKYLRTFSRFSTTSPHNKQLDGTRLLSTETECLSYLRDVEQLKIPEMLEIDGIFYSCAEKLRKISCETSHGKTYFT